MSYFVVATGAVPPIDDVAGLRWVPAADTQDYVARIVSRTVPEHRRAVTFLLDDGTLTSDSVVGEAGDAVFAGPRSRRHASGRW